MYINNPKKTRSQNELTYLTSEEADVYDQNDSKAKLIERNMPGIPLVPNKIERITNSPNKLDINFLIMSHDNADYDKREYREESVIRIDNYISLNNQIIDSFVKERFDNSELYRKFINEQDFKEYFLIRQIREDRKTIKNFFKAGNVENISLHNKQMENEIKIVFQEKKINEEQIKKLQTNNLELKEELFKINNISESYKKKEFVINLDNVHQAILSLTENDKIKDYQSDTQIEGITFLQHIYVLIKYKQQYPKSSDSSIKLDELIKYIRQNTSDTEIKFVLDVLYFKKDVSLNFVKGTLESRMKENDSLIQQYSEKKYDNILQQYYRSLQ